MQVDDTSGYRGRLPHLTKRGCTYYVTFCTRGREVLSPTARDLVLASSTYDHGHLCWMDCVVVMPDHVHLLVTPYETANIGDILRRIKSASAYRVNRHTGRRRPLWQRESFDRLVRAGENPDRKRAYIFHNPVRAGLVARPEDYPWFWSPP